MLHVENERKSLVPFVNQMKLTGLNLLSLHLKATQNKCSSEHSHSVKQIIARAMLTNLIRQPQTICYQPMILIFTILHF